MAKRLVMIPPFDALTGNLSGEQVLKYAENNNPAYYSPVGKRNYARNYQTRYIGAKRASDGLVYFQVKTKNAVGMTPGLKKAMALLGGTGALYAACIMDATKKAQMVNFFNKASEAAPATMAQYTFKSYWSESIRKMLKEKRAILTKTGAGASVTIQNPWVNTSTLDVTVSDQVLVKFWGELSNATLEFTVDGAPGVAHTGNEFDDIVESSYNVLGLAKVTINSSQYIKMGDSFVLNPEGNYVTPSDAVTAAKYTTTTQEPD